jgi:hypothetical protein
VPMPDSEYAGDQDKGGLHFLFFAAAYHCMPLAVELR